MSTHDRRTDRFNIIADIRKRTRIGAGPASDTDCPQIVELADRLLEVNVLAAFVNSDECEESDRERLRDLVPAAAYLQLLCNLADLRSQLARRIRKTTGRSHQILIDVSSFFDDYEPANPTSRAI